MADIVRDSTISQYMTECTKLSTGEQEGDDAPFKPCELDARCKDSIETHIIVYRKGRVLVHGDGVNGGGDSPLKLRIRTLTDQ